MSYRPKYNDSENNKVDLPVDAETLTGKSVEPNSVDDNRSDTLPTSKQVKDYVDYLIATRYSKGETDALLEAKFDKSKIGIVDLHSYDDNSLTPSQISEIQKDYCIIVYENDDDNIYTTYYKHKAYTNEDDEDIVIFKQLFQPVSALSNIIIRSRDIECNITNATYTFETVEYLVYTKTQTNALLNAKINISDIIDTLISTATNKPLSANQGKVLKDLIDACISKDSSGNITEVLHLVNGIASKEDEDYPMQSFIKLGSGTRKSSVDIMADGEESGARIILHGTSSPDSCGTAQIYGDLSINSKTKPIVYEDGVQKQLAYLSDISHLYEHHIVIADNSNLDIAENYAAFTILSTNNTELNAGYKIANALINKGITSASVALKASGRCSEISFNYVEEVMFDESDVNSGTCVSSVIGVYGYDDDPTVLKIVYADYDYNMAHPRIKSKTASTTYVHDTVVPLF